MKPTNPELPPLSNIDAGLLSACIHCGLCLPACPTYLASGRETESPRGRIYLLNQWNEGSLPLDEQLVEHIDSCLGCLGCQTACPSGVQYDKIINQARPYLAEKRSRLQRSLMRVIFKWVLPNFLLLRLAGFCLQIWQILQIDKALTALVESSEKAGVTEHEAPHLVRAKRNPLIAAARAFAQWNAFLPKIPRFQRLPIDSVTFGKNTAVMQLFSGCMMDIFYNHVNRSSINLLVAQEVRVQNPKQTCCGALAFHAGENDIACQLAKQNIALFEQTKGAVVVTAAGCGAMLKDYGELLKNDPAWSERAVSFSKRVVDITEALAVGSFKTPPKRTKEKLTVAYHAACHLAHAQNVRLAPEKLLRLLTVPEISVAETASQISNVALVPLQDAEHCCGSAGIYNLMHPEMALKVLDLKMDNIAKTNADIVVSTNPGCLLQLSTGARRRRLSLKIKHICELLADYYL